ncbi:uncharacterized protein LOC133949637 [Platichthys flesus]|uniref:uncharacterized protein LOC133949637 n=1 Tax=Platichthys flesus TaxID=8260 RepID=UPI002DBE27B4|nr:uncharacterized protein LOC133949637 [Platichthys flesus]
MLLVEVSIFLLLGLSAGVQGLTVKPGEDATLQCHCPSHAAVSMLEWTRLEQKSHGYVFFYRNNRLIEDYHDPSFQGRVKLRDPEMEDGDVSVTLKNVTVNDTGTYKCTITSIITENGERTTTDEFSTFVSLTVTDSGPSAPLKLAEGNKGEGNKDEGDKDEGDYGGGNEDEGDYGEGNKDEGDYGGGNKDEGDYGVQGLTVKPGEDATLQCHHPSHAAVSMLEWTRLEQKSDDYVFFYRNNRLYKDYQDPSFQGRVELRDPEMEDGDVSVTLKNVTVNDAGTYKCTITSIITENGERTTTDEFSTFVSLTVTDSGPSVPLKLAEGNKGEGNKDEGDKDEGAYGGVNEDEGDYGEGNKDEGDYGGGNKDEGDYGEGNKDGRKIQEPVVIAPFLKVAVLLLIIIAVVFIRNKMMNRHTNVLGRCCSQVLKVSERFTHKCSRVLLED